MNVRTVGLVICLCLAAAWDCTGLALGQTKPEIFPQMGHLGAVYSIAFSPDGRLAISGSHDNKAKLWDVATGRLIRTLLGHSRQVVSVVFSPDGRLALSGSDDKTARLWDVATGQVMHILQGHSAMVKSVAFSPDGRLALTGSWDDTLKIWEVGTGREIRTFRGHSKSVESVAFSPDGRLALSGSRDKTIKVWDVASGQNIKTLEGHSDMVISVAFSPDGRLAISGSYDKSVKLWDMNTGQEIRTLRGHSQVLRAVAFSQNGRLALSGDGDQALKVWDVNTGRELKTLGGHSKGVIAVAFSPDGKLALSSGFVTGQIEYDLSSGLGWATKLWDMDTGQEIRTLRGYTNWVLSVAFSPDGRLALSGSADRTIKIWDVASGRQIKTLEGHSSWVQSVAFSPDGKLALSGSQDKTVKIWDVDAGQEIRTLREDSYLVRSVAFSPDGRRALSAGTILYSVNPLKYDYIVKVWDVASGQEIRTLHGHKSSYSESHAFSPDGRLALFDSHDKKALKVLDISSGKEVQILRGYISFDSHAFSSDGRLILFAQGDGTIQVWDLASGREIRTLRGHEKRTLRGGENWVTSLAFSSDGRLAISGSSDGEVKVWDVASGQEIRVLRGHENWITSLAFSPDRRLAISGSYDGTVRVWDVASGQELTQLVGFDGGEWVAIMPEGYYAASLRGHEFLNVRWKNSVYSINQFYDIFYRPDIVEQKLKGKDISALITVTIEEAIRRPPPVVEFIHAAKTTTKSSESIKYRVKSAGGGIGEIRVFHNGKLIQSDGHYRTRAGVRLKDRIEDLNSSAIYAQLRGIALIERSIPSPIVSRSKGDIYDGMVEIEPVTGENVVSIAAFNADNTVQSYMKSVTFQAEVKPLTPHLYILAIGTDCYKYDRINLKYAAKDAREITGMLVKQVGMIFDPGNIHHQILIDEQATKAKILSKIDELAKKTRPTDTFILFVAGHGILTGDQYFMVTHDYNGNLGDYCLISSNEIVEASKKLKALNQLIIFDTCHAGGVDYIINGLYDARMSVLARKMGLHVYAAASSVQEAIDGYQGNGLFSHSLIKGLNNNQAADQNMNNEVSVVELGQYSKTQTVEISRRIGHRQIPLIISFGRDVPLYRLR